MGYGQFRFASFCLFAYACFALHFIILLETHELFVVRQGLTDTAIAAIRGASAQVLQEIDDRVRRLEVLEERLIATVFYLSDKS